MGWAWSVEAEDETIESVSSMARLLGFESWAFRLQPVCPKKVIEQCLNLLIYKLGITVEPTSLGGCEE